MRVLAFFVVGENERIKKYLQLAAKNNQIEKRLSETQQVLIIN
jgi:hypothetical protein